MDTNTRNRKIKKELSKEFGYKNVKVVGGRGTAYGWVEITIYTKLPKQEYDESGLPMYSERTEIMENIEKKVYKILNDTGLIDEIGCYYDDWGDCRKEVLVDVKDVNYKY